MRRWYEKDSGFSLGGLGALGFRVLVLGVWGLQGVGGFSVWGFGGSGLCSVP